MIRPNTQIPNTESYERDILIDSSGFREYDARWRFPEQINLQGFTALGRALGMLLHEEGVRPDIVVGHDYRSYSMAVKQGLVIGLMASGCRVHDIGLCLSPTAYYAQFALDCPAVAMVTASHNENGWTGVKMGAHRPLTFGPELMGKLKEIALGGKYTDRPGGTYHLIPDIKARYLADLTKGRFLRRKLKAVVACGNGTAGMYAPQALQKLGCEVVPLDCQPDYTFPNCNPNPEDLAMLSLVKRKVLETGADLGFAFDGDGDRCGVVDETGEEIFADKMGVILARYLCRIYSNRRFVADIKSTGLFSTDPVLKELGAQTDYWITGHSYIKRRVQELGALCGFEKSGHYFFNAPIGRGYDDAILSAIMICLMMDYYPSAALSEMKESLPKTWSSPTMSPACPDDLKYQVVKRITQIYQDKKNKGEKILNQKIKEIITVNGARIVLEDGTWGLVRASSNKPCLVVVVESPASELAMQAIFDELDRSLSIFPEVGKYDQKFSIAA